MVVIRIALFCCLISGWSCISSYGAEAPKREQRTRLEPPVHIKPDAKTRRDYEKAERAWSERMLAAPFRERTKGEPWAEDAAKFVSRALDAWPGEIIAPGPDALAAEGKVLIDKGCKDPFVAYLAAWARWEETGEWHAARNTFREILPAAEKIPGPRALARLIALDLVRACVTGRRDPKDAPEKAAQWTAEVWEDGSYLPAEDFLLVHQTVAGRWDAALDKNPKGFVTAINGSKLPKWARLTILGELEINLAWDARGGGFSDTVTQEGLKEFGRHLQKARENLVEAWELRPDRPEAAAMMIAVVMGGEAEPGESLRLWWDRASGAELGYFDASVTLMNAYLPRWGGSHQRMLAFAEACLNAERPDSDLPMALFCALSNMNRDFADLRSLYSNRAIAPLVIKASQALVDEPTRARERRERLSTLAVNAWLAGDDARAAAALKEVGPKNLGITARNKIASVHIDEAAFRGDVAIRNSPARELFLKGESSYANQDFESAVESYRKALDLAPEGAAQTLLRGRLAVIETEQELAEGKWATIHPDIDLAGWTAVVGKWFASPDGLPASRESQGTLRMIYGAKVGAEFEMRGEIAISGEPTTEHMVGLLYGHYYDDNFQRWFGCYGYFDTDANAPRVMALMRDGDMKAPTLKCSLQERNTFYIKVEDGKLTWEFNGQLMHKDFPLPEELTDNGKVGLGSWSHEAGVTMTLKHLEVRRLPKAKN